MSVRLFVAAELPQPVVDALVEWRPHDERLRLLAPEALHVTLAFLGWRDEADIAPAAAIVEQHARVVTSLTLDEPVWLPPRRPRVLAVRLADPGALAALQADVAAALAQAVTWQPERRPFLAHVTVARARSGFRGAALDPLPAVEPFAASALTLFRSHLGAGGSRYEALARASLDPG